MPATPQDEKIQPPNRRNKEAISPRPILAQKSSAKATPGHRPSRLSFVLYAILEIRDDVLKLLLVLRIRRHQVLVRL